MSDRERREPAPLPEQVIPTPAESWERNIEILDLVNQIREARRRRLEESRER